MKQEIIKEMRYKISDIHHEVCQMHSKVYKSLQKERNQEDQLLFDILGATTENIYALCITLSKMIK